jgi:hypothetical protein
MKAILTSSLSILSLLASSQQDTMMVGVGTGWQMYTQLDEFLSPLSYQGNGAMIQVCLQERNDRFYDRLALTYQQSRISPAINNGSTALSYRGNIDWIRAYYLGKGSGRWSTYLGFHFLTTYQAASHEQWPNNSYSHCLALSLGPSLVLDYASQWRGIHVGWEFSFPLLNYIVRPSLGSLYPEGSIRRSRQNAWGVISGGKITSLHEYQRIYSNLFFTFRLAPRLTGRTGYIWDYQRCAINNLYRSASHLVYVTVYFRFQK